MANEDYEADDFSDELNDRDNRIIESSRCVLHENLFTQMEALKHMSANEQDDMLDLCDSFVHERNAMHALIRDVIKQRKPIEIEAATTAEATTDRNGKKKRKIYKLIDSNSSKAIANMYKQQLNFLHNYSGSCTIRATNNYNLMGYMHKSKEVYTNFSGGTDQDMIDEEKSVAGSTADLLEYIQFQNIDRSYLKFTDASRMVNVRILFTSTPTVMAGNMYDMPRHSQAGFKNRKNRRNRSRYTNKHGAVDVDDDDDDDDYDDNYDDNIEMDDSDQSNTEDDDDDDDDEDNNKIVTAKYRKRTGSATAATAAAKTNESKKLRLKKKQLMKYIQHPIHQTAIKLIDFVFFNATECWNLWNDVLDRCLQVFQHRRMYPIKDSLYRIIMVAIRCNSNGTRLSTESGWWYGKDATEKIVPIHEHGLLTKLGLLVDFVNSFRVLMRQTLLCCCYAINRQATHRLHYTKKHVCHFPATSQGVYQELFLTSRIGHDLVCNLPCDTTKHCYKWLVTYQQAREIVYHQKRFTFTDRLRQHLSVLTDDYHGGFYANLPQYQTSNANIVD